MHYLFSLRGLLIAALALAVAAVSHPTFAQQPTARPAKPKPSPSRPASVPDVKPRPDQPRAAESSGSDVGGADASARAVRTEPAPLTEPKPSQPEIFEPVDPAKGYTLGVGDVVRITVFQQPDMVTEARVSEVGTIAVPLLGPVEVGSLSTKQVEMRIANQLRARGLVREPYVNVTILQFKSRQVSVLGYVNRPGRFALEEGIYRMTDVLALAGGAISGASDSVTLLRISEGKVVKFDLDLPTMFRAAASEQNVEVLPGDTVYVEKAPVFYIYGEVQRPGAYRLEKDMTVMQALSVGGGLTLRGTEKNMRLTRRGAQGKLDTMVPAMNDLVYPDDVINVRQSLF